MLIRMLYMSVGMIARYICCVKYKKLEGRHRQVPPHPLTWRPYAIRTYPEWGDGLDTSRCPEASDQNCLRDRQQRASTSSSQLCL